MIYFLVYYDFEEEEKANFYIGKELVKAHNQEAEPDLTKEVV